MDPSAVTSPDRNSTTTITTTTTTVQSQNHKCINVIPPPSAQSPESTGLLHLPAAQAGPSTLQAAHPALMFTVAAGQSPAYDISGTSSRIDLAGSSSSQASPSNSPAGQSLSYAGAGQSGGRSSVAGGYAPISHRGTAGGGQQQPQQTLERLSRPMAFDKMEFLMREMQDPETGVPVRSQKTFLSSIPLAFMGYDLIEWLMERLTVEESEALSIANQLCMHGYFFPTNEYNKSLLVKDDSSLYRFQSPYYFPWQHRAPDNVEYAIFLLKRSLRNKQRHGLEDYESEALASLKQNLKAKWEFIQMQAQEQIRLSKDRKKGDKVIFDSQERAYWRIHRPPPAQFTPMEPCPIPSRDRQGRPRRRTVDDWQREVDYLRLAMNRTRMNMSQACEGLSQYSETFADYDFFLQNVVPSNPWVTDDITYWQLNHQIVDIPAERRVRRWAISIEEVVSDPTGLQEFTAYLKKEYSHENIRFWNAVNDLRRSAASQITTKVREIYEEFLEPGAPCEINIDGKTMENVQKGLKTPSRFTFDAAAEHIYTLLLKKDCYPRFIRSEHYKMLLATGIQQPHKKRFFGFGSNTKKKSTTTQPAQSSLLNQVPSTSVGGGPPTMAITRRRGSDRSLTGSAHELAVLGVRDTSGSKVPHSHSQSNLTDIPYSMVYRGDMPSTGFPILSANQEDPASIINTACHTTTVTGAAVVVVSAAAAYNPSNDARSTALVDTIVDSTAALEVSVAAAANSSSVCPWDDPPESETMTHSSVQVSVCAPDTSPATTKRMSKPRNHSTNDSSNSAAADISDVSDRMRRSCGIRQSTIDCDMVGQKRLEPIGREQRRSSISITQRLPEHNWTSVQPIESTSIDLDVLPIAQESKLMCDVESVDKFVKDGNQLISTCTIESEAPMITIISEEHLSDVAHNLDSEPTPIPGGVSNVDEEPLIEKSTTPTANTVRRPDELAINETAALEDSTTPNVVPFSLTPTITVVSCPLEENSTNTLVTTTDPNKTNENLAAAPANSTPLTTTSSLRQATSIPGTDPSDGYAMEELSPTTEEYQECCAPDDFQLEGEVLAPGCVAPAPTPAPSIAPLAEVEGDPADDDPDIDDDMQPPSGIDFVASVGMTMATATPASVDPSGVVTETVATAQTPSKRHHRKKRSSDAQKPTDAAGAATSDSRQGSEELSGPNMVCPWDDEDVSSSTEKPFVKTYATLGYL